VRLRTNHRADPHYLNYLINCSGFLFFARKLAIQSVQQSNLNATRYCRLLIPRPPLDEQRAIAVYLDDKTSQIADVVSRIESQISSLTAFRKALIYECVTGQKRISETDLKKVQAYG
jgi:type I restriction enzyme S subunit